MSQKTLQNQRSDRNLASYPPSLRVATSMLRNYVTNNLIKGLVDNDAAVRSYEEIDNLVTIIALPNRDHAGSKAIRGKA